jgi:PAS domain S-box-containing protein
MILESGWNRNAMSPGKETDECTQFRAKTAELQAELLRHKELLTASEGRFQVLADAAPIMMWTSGAEGPANFFNRMWLEYRGRAASQESVGSWMDGLHPDDRDSCLDTYLRSMSERRPFRIQYRLRRADGEYLWFEDSAAPAFMPSGEYLGFVGVLIDITDRKRGYFTPDPDAVRIVFALTERERQVLVLIASGKSTKEAATQLGISYKTADSHRSRILEKLGVHETASMVRYAIRSGLVAP